MAGYNGSVGEGTRSMRLWLDDARKPPWGYDLWAKTVEEAIDMLERHGSKIEHASLDHDLDEAHYAFQYGDHPPKWDRSKFAVKTGYALLEWMRENFWVADIHVHSLSTGAGDMMDFLKKYAPEWVKHKRVKPREI